VIVVQRAKASARLDPSVSTPPKEWPYSTLQKSPPLEHVLESHWSIHLQAYSRLVALLSFKHDTEEYKEVKKKRWFVITKNRHALKEPLRDSSASIYYQVIVTAFITQRLLLFVFVPKWKKNKWYIYYLVSCFGPVTLVSHAPAADEQDYLHTHTHTHTPATPCWTCSVSIHYEQSQVVSTQCLLLFFMVSCTAYSHLCECAPCIIVNIKYTKLVFI